MKKHILIIAMFFFFSSCNYYKLAYHQLSKKLEHAGLSYHTIKLSNSTVCYWDSETSKPVLVLLHGFGASTEFQWYKQVSDLSKQFRVILPNLLYFGESTSSDAGFSVDAQVKVLQELINKLDIKSFSLGGVSYGGLIAAELASQEQSKITKLIIVDAPIKFFTEADSKVVLDFYQVNSFEELLVPSHYKQLHKLISVAFLKPPKAPGFLLKSFYKNSVQPHSEEQKQLIKSLSQEQSVFLKKGYKFNFPVLIIWGESDHLIPLHVGKDLKSYLGEKAELLVIPKTAHMPILEAPELSTKSMLDFLKK